MENDEIRFKIPGCRSLIDRLKTIRNDPLQLALKKKLISINVWDTPQVQQWNRLVEVGTPFGRERSLKLLAQVMQDYEKLQIELDDPYMPFFTAEQISNSGHGIRILEQAYNGFPLYRDQDSLLRGLLVIGRPTFGKSSAVFNILGQITPDIGFLGLDFKGSWKLYCPLLQAKYIDWDFASFDLQPPPGISWEHWLFVVSEAISHVCGLQYSQDLVVEAGQICLRQKQGYETRSGIGTSICLKDIKLALNPCSTGNPKKAQYLESAKTALSLIIGSEDQRIFSTRQGLPLSEILKGRYFIGCQYANTFQSRFLLVYILLFQQYSYTGQGQPESRTLKHITILDDASRAISQAFSIFGSGSKFGPFMHTLKVVRASGEGYIFVDQLVSPMVEEIKLLANSWLAIGSIGGKQELDELARAMHLNEDQKNMLSQLAVRECVSYCPELGRSIHGYIPIVNGPTQENG